MLNGNELMPPPPPPRVGRLDSLRGVRRELARLYTDARQGRIQTGDASRLAFILATLAKILEQADLESRVAQLEDALNGKGK